MKIKVIDYGYERLPERKHYDDAGADLRAIEDCRIQPLETKMVPLGVSFEIPNGYVGFLTPRSGLTKTGIIGHLGTVDSGFRGHLHATLTNLTNAKYLVKKGDRVGQLVVVPIALPDFVSELPDEERGTDGYGSTGK